MALLSDTQAARSTVTDTPVRAAFLSGPRTFEVRPVDAVAARGDYVRIRIEACGICGSNLHAWRNPEHGIDGGGTAGAAGHEVCGRADDGAHRGSLVVVEPNLAGACSTCEACIAGTAWFCRDRLPVQTWGFADEMAVRSDSVFPVPPGVDAATATLTEPLACGVHALRWSHTAQTRGLAGARVAVLGSGVAGLLALVAAQHLGAASVVATARHPHQAEAARDLGADDVVSVDDLKGLRSGRHDIVVEAVGAAAPTLDLAMKAVRPGGEVVVLGLFDHPQPIDARRAVFRELRTFFPVTYGVLDGVHDYSIALEILAERSSALAPLVTHRFGLSDIGAAFRTADDKASGSLRVVVTP